MGDLERRAEFDKMMGEVEGLPVEMPENPEEIANLIEVFRAIRMRMSEVERLTNDAGSGYEIGKCNRCNRDQYQHSNGERATDTLGRTLQANLWGIGGCQCAWPS